MNASIEKDYRNVFPGTHDFSSVSQFVGGHRYEENSIIFDEFRKMRATRLRYLRHSQYDYNLNTRKIFKIIFDDMLIHSNGLKNTRCVMKFNTKI